MSNRIVVFGAGGHAAVVLECARSVGLEISAVIDEDATKKNLLDLPVLTWDFAQDILEPSFQFIVAIGDNLIRQKVHKRMCSLGGSPITIIHPRAIVSESSQIGEGSVIMPGVIVNSRAQIGEACILNTGCSIDHDCVLREFVHICPGVRLAGGVRVGEATLVGIGASVIQGISIGCSSVLGAGSVVVNDIPDRCMAYGNPAVVRRMMTHET